MRRTLGALFSAGPFVAALVAAASPRRDFRLAAMAVVATLAAWLLLRTSSHSPARALTAFAAATGTAAIASLIAGARAASGIIAVAVVVGAFATIGQLLLLPRRQTLAAP